MQEHGSTGSFGERGDVRGTRRGRGSARRVADRRLDRRVLPGCGENGPRPRRIGPEGRGQRQGRRIGPDAAADQPGAELRAGTGQPRLDGPHRAAQSPRRLLVAEPLQVAQQHGQPEPVGEPAEFLVQLGPGLGARSDLRLAATDRHGRLRPAALAPGAGQHPAWPDPRPAPPSRTASSPASPRGGSPAPAAPAPGTSPARRPRRRGGPRGSARRPAAPGAHGGPPGPRTPPRTPRPTRAGTAPKARRRTIPSACPRGTATKSG